MKSVKIFHSVLMRHISVAALAILPLLATSCSSDDGGDPHGNKVVAAYVMDDDGVTVAASFGYPGSSGMAARGDHFRNGGDIICKYADENPLQAACNWAAANGKTTVLLDEGTFTFNTQQAGYRGSVGFFIPSGIHLKGFVRDGVPVSVLAPSERLVNIARGSPSGRSFDILLQAGGSLTDNSRLNDGTTIESVFIDNRFAGGVCLWMNGGTGCKLTGVHSQNSINSSLIIGDWTRKENPDMPYTSIILYAEDFEVSGCKVYNANGDGIAAVGRNGVIRDNVCLNGTTEFDNGITCYVGSSGITIRDNHIDNYPCGIGLDGTFMIPILDGKTEEESAAICKQKDIDLYDGWTGVIKDFDINGNTIENCKRGIIFWRVADSIIRDNEMSDCINDGIGLEEACYNYVWGNTVHGCGMAFRLYAYLESPYDDGQLIGTSYNKVGIDGSGNEPGNNFRNNDWGLFFESNSGGPITGNSFINNDITGCNDSMEP